MKNKEVVERILAYHPSVPGYQGCDDWKVGDPEAECTGVVTALVPTMNVLREAVRIGANLLIVHEPIFYTSEDSGTWKEDFANQVYEEKMAYINEHGLTVWRDHDHMHMHQPDGIFHGVIRELGWAGHETVDTSCGGFAHFIIDLPEPMTVGALCRHLIDTIGMNGVRYIGDPDREIRSLAIVGHLFPDGFGLTRKDGSPTEYGDQVIRTLEERVDAIIPGEVIEWTTLAYCRDAVEQGRTKAMINLGHMNWEELGMKYAEQWIGELIRGSGLPVTYVPTGDMYRYML